MTRVLLLVLLLLAVLVPGAGFAADEGNQVNSALYEKLTLANENGGLPAIDKLIDEHGLNNFQDLNTLSIWLRDEYKKPQRNQRYGLMYADALYNMSKSFKDGGRPLLDTGTFVFFSSELIARENVARCTDTTAVSAHLQQWGSDLKKTYYQHYLSMSPEDKEQTLKLIMDFTQSRDLSYKDKVACAVGIKAMSQAVEEGKCSKDGSCDSSEYVTFIEDEEWQKKRQEVRDALVKYLSSPKK